MLLKQQSKKSKDFRTKDRARHAARAATETQKQRVVMLQQMTAQATIADCSPTGSAYCRDQRCLATG